VHHAGQRFTESRLERAQRSWACLAEMTCGRQGKAIGGTSDVR